MTLRAIFDKEKSAKIKEEMPDELLVYKVALIVGKKGHRPKYFSPVIFKEYKDGVQESVLYDLTAKAAPVADKEQKQRFYYPGFHSFAKKSSAEKLLSRLFRRMNADAVILTCGVLKRWIIAMGFEGDRDLVVVSSRILMPSYPHTDIRQDKNCESFAGLDEEVIGFNAYLKKGLPLSSCSDKLSCPGDWEK